MDKTFLYIHIFTTRGNLTFAIARMSFAIAAMSLLDMSCACCAFAHSRGEQVLFAWWTCFLSYSGNCTVEIRKKNTFTGIKASALKWSTALQTLMSLFFFFFLGNIWTVFPKLPSLVGSRFSALSEVVQTFWKRLSRSMAAASRLSRVQRVHVTAQSASVCTCPRRKR